MLIQGLILPVISLATVYWLINTLGSSNIFLISSCLFFSCCSFSFVFFFLFQNFDFCFYFCFLSFIFIIIIIQLSLISSSLSSSQRSHQRCHGPHTSCTRSSMENMSAFRSQSLQPLPLLPPSRAGCECV